MLQPEGGVAVRAMSLCKCSSFLPSDRGRRREATDKSRKRLHIPRGSNFLPHAGKRAEPLGLSVMLSSAARTSSLHSAVPGHNAPHNDPADPRGLPACCHSPGGCRVLCLLAGPAAARWHMQDTESPPAWNCKQQTQTRKKEGSCRLRRTLRSPALSRPAIGLGPLGTYHPTAPKSQCLSIQRH